MRRNLFSPDKTIYPDVAEPVEIGGTGGTTPRAAIDELQGISILDVGHSGSAVPLDENTKVPLQFIPTMEAHVDDTIVEPLEVFAGTTAIFFISNYDASRPYVFTNLELDSESNEPQTLITCDDYLTCKLINQGGAH